MVGCYGVYVMKGANVDTEKALIENDGIELAAVHIPNDEGDAVCGADVSSGVCNVESGQVGDMWCEDCTGDA